MRNKPCKSGGCPNLTIVGKAYCDKCQKSKERIREHDRQHLDPHIEQFRHSKEWKQLRAEIIASNPFCKCQKLTTEVHHLLSVRDYWDKRLDKDNLIALCKSCHSRETMRELRKKL